MMRSLLLGTAAGFVAMSAYATDLPDKTRPVEYTKIGCNDLKARNITAFYGEENSGSKLPTPPRQNYYGDVFALASSAKAPAVYIPIVQNTHLEGAGLIGPALAQKLLSSSVYRGTPSHGFHHVLGKLPAFATKMLA